MRAVGTMAAGLAEPSTSEGLTTIVNGVGKAEAKKALVEQSQGIAEGQLKEVMGQIVKATTKESVTVEKLENGVMRVLKERPGNDGKQVIESLVNSEGKKNIVQRAYDSTCKLVHEDSKLTQFQ
jgi:hypothetical protein